MVSSCQKQTVMLSLPFDFLNTESTPVTDDTIQLHSQQHISRWVCMFQFMEA